MSPKSKSAQGGGKLEEATTRDLSLLVRGGVGAAEHLPDFRDAGGHRDAVGGEHEQLFRPVREQLEPGLGKGRRGLAEGCDHPAARNLGQGLAALQPHQFRQHQRTRHDGNFLFARGDDFGIGFLHRGRGDHRIGVGNIFAGVLVMDARTQLRQPLRHRVVGQIGAGHRIAQVQQHLGDAAHADAPNAYEVDMFDGVFHGR